MAGAVASAAVMAVAAPRQRRERFQRVMSILPSGRPPGRAFLRMDYPRRPPEVVTDFTHLGIAAPESDGEGLRPCVPRLELTPRSPAPRPVIVGIFRRGETGRGRPAVIRNPEASETS